jgi:predicted short-subunit dehydrogenase-like oxidoreductase (DUF2520 family)
VSSLVKLSASGQSALISESLTSSARGEATGMTSGQKNRRSVAVVIGLERPVDRSDADVLGLLRRQLRELGADLVEVQAGDLSSRCLGST